jgi:hypothetical protein
MKSCHQAALGTVFLCFILNIGFAQDQRAFNQNASRSNHTRLSFSFSPVYSSSINNNADSLLFRGSGPGFRLGADYFLGKAGISFSSGFSSSSPDDAAINNFIKNSSIPSDQILVSKSRQQNIYLLLGPSVRFGNMVELYAHAKGGLFINNSGMVNIQQRGAQRSLYRNESTDKTAFPGFMTGMMVQYKTKSELWSFGLGADYLRTQAEVNNYDARRGGGIEGLKLRQTISDIVTGITIRYNITSPRDAASGQASGKRVLPTVNKREMAAPRDAASGLATGKRLYQPGQPVYGNITREQNPDESCGNVTRTTTKPDGTIEETTFSCPADAAAYDRQTPKTDFGDKVSARSADAGIQSAPEAGSSKGIVSGRLTWASSGTAMGIVTNKTITRSGSTTLNSQSSSTRTTNQSSFGTLVRLSARDAGSGMATGKRSRDAGSGLATGRRQYEPIFMEGQGDICNPCLATAKMSSVKNNPLYDDKGTSGVNPLFESNKRTTNDTDEDCDGIAGIDISLLDANTGMVVAKTKTESCGDFFFANVPEGNYVVRTTGAFAGKKGYDMYLKSKMDLQGGIVAADNWDVQLLINTGNGNDENVQKAGISTSRSNIRTKSIAIIEADLDGDGEYESLRATATFSDGSSSDITTATKKSVSNASGTKGIVLEANAMQMGRRRVEVLKSNKQGDPGANRITSIAISENGSRAIAVFSDGSNRDVTDDLEVNTDHNGVRQYSISILDSDNDGLADAINKIKTKSNIKNDRVASGDVNGDGATEAVMKIKTKSNIKNDRMAGADTDDDGIWSPRSNIKILKPIATDVDGDGKTDMSVAAPFVPGGTVVSAAMIPGDPIPGLDVKLGKNPGGQLIGSSSNQNGEFEFTNLEAGDYTIILQQNIFINDETFVVVGNTTKAQDHNSSRSNKTASAIDNSGNGTNTGKVQDHNSSRSNKSASIINNPNQGNGATTEFVKSILIEADLDGDGSYETNISNRLTDAFTVDEDGTTNLPQQKAGVSTSRSNIRSRRALVSKGDGLYLCHATALIDNNEVEVQIIYKSSHDMQMGAIRNLK